MDRTEFRKIERPIRLSQLLARVGRIAAEAGTDPDELPLDEGLLAAAIVPAAHF